MTKLNISYCNISRNSTQKFNSFGRHFTGMGYYPYGEPWREPSGQPMLFAGKERTPQADYLFGPRTYNPAALFWHAPDIFAGKYTNISPFAYCFCNPIRFSDLTGMAPSSLEAALMSLCAYQEDDEMSKWALSELGKRNWSISTAETGINYNSTGLVGSGLQSILFNKVDPDNQEIVEFAYAFAGTNDIQDCCEDVLQLFGISSQYHMAVDNAVILSDWCKEKELTFVGHSLGGGEAAASSMKTGRDAITFNAASISSFTIATLELSKSGNIKNFVSSGSTALFGKKIGGDPLTNFQNNIGAPAKGQSIGVPIGLTGPIQSHSIKNLIHALAR